MEGEGEEGFFASSSSFAFCTLASDLTGLFCSLVACFEAGCLAAAAAPPPPLGLAAAAILEGAEEGSVEEVLETEFRLEEEENDEAEDVLQASE